MTQGEEHQVFDSLRKAHRCRKEDGMTEQQEGSLGQFSQDLERVMKNLRLCPKHNRELLLGLHRGAL